MKANSKSINYVDFLLITISVIVLVVFISVFFKDSAQVDFSQKETITLTLRVKNIHIKHENLIKSGDRICFSDGGKELGTIKYVGYDSETVEFLDKLTNASSVYKSPDRKTALILVESDSDVVDNEYYVSENKIVKGEVIDVFVPSYAFNATIVNIESNKE